MDKDVRPTKITYNQFDKGIINIAVDNKTWVIGRDIHNNFFFYADANDTKFDCHPLDLPFVDKQNYLEHGLITIRSVFNDWFWDYERDMWIAA